MIGPGNDLRLLELGFREHLTKKVIEATKDSFKHGAVNIKKEWQANLLESDFWGQIATTVGFDDVSNQPAGVIAYQIGTTPSPRKPEGAPRVKKDSGGLVHISLGWTKRGGGHRKDPFEFLEAEAPNMERHIDKLLQEVFLK